MAKQSGIHQIRGKIGENSYYRQTGISSGLIRSINQGMSERVKTSPEYANTRLNNIEFKIATQTAGALFAGVQPILRPTRTLFRTSRLAADLYHILEHNTGAWGDRVFSPDNSTEICLDMLKFAKRKMSEYAVVTLGEYNSATHKQVINLLFPSDLDVYMETMGANYMQFKVYQMHLYISPAPSVTGFVSEPYPILQAVQTEEYELGASDPGTSISSTIECYGPSLVHLVDHAFISFFVVVALPIRRTADGEQVLQNDCTFTILSDPNEYV